MLSKKSLHVKIRIHQISIQQDLNIAIIMAYAAKELNISSRTLYRKIKEGKITDEDIEKIEHILAQIVVKQSVC
ncbi:MAG TPA: helix-turn-helix domain-containing protein [Saprospiraceae bacterium]|mgnify:CR=1 FL=1|nr:helix-turn-helix domain-containing protein [Saprospiraceae bacterium]HMP13478.1 helix-turn-helix domain-containing protein [Saprospiraceae bacterium]